MDEVEQVQAQTPSTANWLIAVTRLPMATVAVLALGGAGLSAPALGQTGIATSPSLPPPLPAGPVTDTSVTVDTSRVYGDDSDVFSPFALLGGFGYDISGSLQTRYSDNVARTEPGTPLRNGLVSRTDWSFQPTMNLSGRRPLGQQALFFNLTAGKTFYARNSLLDRATLAAGGGLQWRLGSRCGGTLQGGWTQRGTQFASFLDVVPSKTDTTRFAVNANCASATGLSANISYDFSDIRNTVEVLQPGVLDRSFADVRSSGFNGGLGYRLSSRGQIGVQGQWRRATFPHQLLPGGGANGNTITGANGFANYRLGRSLKLHGSLGYSSVKRAYGGGQAFKGSVWEAGVDYSGPRLGASLTSGRSVNGSSGGLANYSVTKFTNGTVSYRANSRLSAAAGFSQRDYDLGDTLNAPGAGVVDTRNIRRYFVGGDYTMNRLLSFSLDYNHQRMRTNIAQYRYSENSVIFGIRARL